MNRLVIDPGFVEAFAARKPGAVGFKATIQSAQDVVQGGSIVLVAEYHGSATPESDFAKLSNEITSHEGLSCTDCLFLFNTSGTSERGKWTIIVYLGSKDTKMHLLFACSRNVVMQAFGMDNFSAHCYCARSAEDMAYAQFNSSYLAARSPLLTPLEEIEKDIRRSRSALFEFPPNASVPPFKLSTKLEEAVSLIVKEEGGTNWLEIQITEEEELDLVVSEKVSVQDDDFRNGQINNDEPRLYIYKHLWGQADGSSTLFLFYTCPEPAQPATRAKYSACVPGLQSYVSMAVTGDNMEVKAAELSDPREVSHGTRSLSFEDGVADVLSREEQYRSSVRSRVNGILHHSVQLHHRPPLPTALSTDHDQVSKTGEGTRRRRPTTRKPPATAAAAMAALDAPAPAAAAPAAAFTLPWIN
jgi:hypothetical protein